MSNGLLFSDSLPHDFDSSGDSHEGSISVATEIGDADDSPNEFTVLVLVCPGPQFSGGRAARYARSATQLCKGRRMIILDLSEVRTMDAAGLLAITSLVRACRSAGGELRLCSPNHAVRVLLAAAGVHHLVDVYHSRRQASLA